MFEQATPEHGLQPKRVIRGAASRSLDIRTRHVLRVLLSIRIVVSILISNSIWFLNIAREAT